VSWGHHLNFMDVSMYPRIYIYVYIYVIRDRDRDRYGYVQAHWDGTWMELSWQNEIWHHQQDINVHTRMVSDRCVLWETCGLCFGLNHFRNHTSKHLQLDSTVYRIDLDLTGKTIRPVSNL
jgi:hypothetical protein